MVRNIQIKEGSTLGAEFGENIAWMKQVSIFAGDIWRNNAGAFKLAALGGILLFSFWMGMNPHWDYRYPLHVDEWFGIGYAQSTLEAGSLEYTDPYGGGAVSFHGEMGFHLILAFLRSVTNLSWMGLYWLAPGFLLTLMTFLTYAFGRRLGFGWSAALLIPLIPTSVRTLGPAFVVPLSVAMLFLPVTLLILFGLRKEKWSVNFILLTVLFAGTMFVHPPSEAIITSTAVLFLGSFVTGALIEKRYKQSGRIVLSLIFRVLAPLLVLSLWLPDLSKEVLLQSFSNEPGLLPLMGSNSGFFQAFGLFGIGVAVMGLALVLLRQSFGLQSYVIPILVGLLLLFLGAFPKFGIGPDVLYERSWSYLGFFFVILIGYFVASYFSEIVTVAKTAERKWGQRFQRLGLLVARGVGVCLVAGILITGLLKNEERSDYQTYYRVVNDVIVSDFNWIGQHTAPGERITMGESSIAWAYPPIGGPGTFVKDANSAPFSSPFSDVMRSMVAGNEIDVQWLRNNDVSIVYSCRPIIFGCHKLTSDELFYVHRGTYIVPPAKEF